MAKGKKIRAFIYSCMDVYRSGRLGLLDNLELWRIVDNVRRPLSLENGGAIIRAYLSEVRIRKCRRRSSSEELFRQLF